MSVSLRLRGSTPLGSPRLQTPRPVFQDGPRDPGTPPSYYRVAAGSFWWSILPGLARLSPPGFRLFSPPFRGTFQLSVTVLVRYRSRDVFSLGSWCLPASHAKTKAWYSGTSAQSLPAYAYGAITLYGGPFQATSASPARERPSPNNPTSPMSCPHGVWFGLCPFRSPLLRASHLVSFPPPTKMLPFGGFPLPKGSATGY